MKLKYHIPLIMSLAMLMAITIPMMALPYCYSEAQILSDSILHMKNHGIGVVFNNETVELPNFFDILIYPIVKYLTTKPLYLHIIMSIISAFTIYIAYKIGKFFFSIHAGVMSAAIMCVQNVFIAQSGLVLPSMLLTLCILGGLYTFFREKYNLCTILLCVASLTDIIGLAASLILLASYIKIKYREWSIFKNIMLCMPIVLWFVYEAISLTICGKFSIRHNVTSIANFANNLYFIFIDQYRFVLTAIIVILITITLIQQKTPYFVKDMANITMQTFVAIIVASSLVDNSESWNLTSICLLSVFAGCLISTLPTSYYTKYLIACTAIVSAAMGCAQRNKVTDAYVNYKSKIKVDIKTVELAQSQSNGTILCDKFFKKYLTVTDLGYNNGTIFYCTTGENDDPTTSYNTAIISGFCTTPADSAICNSDTYEKLNTIFIGNYTNEIYQRKSTK